MIAGIGVDIVDVARIQALLDRYGERFLQKRILGDPAIRAIAARTPPWFGDSHAFFFGSRKAHVTGGPGGVAAGGGAQ